MRLAGLCTTRQFWHGASRSEARIPYGPPARGWKMMGFAGLLYSLFSTRRVCLRGQKVVICDLSGWGCGGGGVLTCDVSVWGRGGC